LLAPVDKKFCLVNGTVAAEVYFASDTYMYRFLAHINQVIAFICVLRLISINLLVSFMMNFNKRKLLKLSYKIASKS